MRAEQFDEAFPPEPTLGDRAEQPANHQERKTGNESFFPVHWGLTGTVLVIATLALTLQFLHEKSSKCKCPTVFKRVLSKLPYVQ
jgi:hypothetical protein